MALQGKVRFGMKNRQEVPHPNIALVLAPFVRRQQTFVCLFRKRLHSGMVVLCEIERENASRRRRIERMILYIDDTLEYGNVRSSKHGVSLPDPWMVTNTFLPYICTTASPPAPPSPPPPKVDTCSSSTTQ